MFTLQIHSVDFPQPLATTIATTSSSVHGPNPNNATNQSTSNILRPVELRGISHLFRYHLPSPHSPAGSGISNPSARSTLLFIVAVPNYLYPDDLLLFCGPHAAHFSEVLFLRNDGMEDRYSVLIRLVDQLSADGFYCSYNGKRFKPSEAEVCHIYFIQSVVYSESADVACTPPQGFTELPTCPVCLERLDQDTSGIQTTLCDHSFHCSCVSKWTYLSCQVCRLCQEQDEKPICAVCGTLKNLWVCLICGFVGCGRYEQGHAIRHWSDTQHHYSLELEKQQIWDYVEDKYVHRLNQSKTDGKLGVTTSRCTAADGECASCVYDEDSMLDSALFSSKVEAIVNEYNHLLASQLEAQRQHYEVMLNDAKSERESSISRTVEKAVFSRIHEMQAELERYEEEKKMVSETNQALMKKQELLQKRFKDIEERISQSLKTRDEKIQDLEEQIRDLTFFIEAQKKMANVTVSDGKEGTVLLPVESNHQAQGNSRRRSSKTTRRRN